MMMPISFFVEGDPKPQPRPRAFARKIGNKFMARVYDAGTAENWKSRVADAAKEFRPNQPLDVPLSVRMDFFFARPKSHHHTGKRAGELRRDAPYYHASRPDLDNLSKAVIDCLMQIGFFKDDALIAVNFTTKNYADHPGVSVRILELESQM